MTPHILPAPSPASVPCSNDLEHATPYRHLITSDLIAQVQSAPRRSIRRKYVQVINELYTVKLGPGVSHYEYRVLQFLETIADIPTPRPLDFFTMDVLVKPNTPRETVESWNVIIMSTVPGKTLQTAAARGALGPEQQVDVLKKVRDCMDHINQIIHAGTRFPDPEGNWTPLQRPADSITDLDQARCLQLPLFNDIKTGPVQLKDFATSMTETALQPADTAELLIFTLNQFQPGNPSEIRFCHMDLHPCNVMVHNGFLSGIIDWELAGWYTWDVEVLGAMKFVLSQFDAAPYLEAWSVPSKMFTIFTHSLPSLKQGWLKRRAEDRRAEMLLNGEANALKAWRERKIQRNRERRAAELAEQAGKSDGLADQCASTPNA